MKRIDYILIFALMSFMCSCSKTGIAVSPDDRTDGLIGFRTSISAGQLVKSPSLDESGSGNFSDGDVFSLMISEEDAGSSVYDYTVGETELFWKEVTTVPDGTNVNFYACYPRQEMQDGIFLFDISGVADYSGKDLLIAMTEGIAKGTETPVDLVFGHAMHRLVVRYAVESGSDIDAGNIETSCTAKSACEVNLRDGSVEATSGSHEFYGAGKEAVFLIVPQESAEVSLEVALDGYVRTFSLTELKGTPAMLEGGKQLTVELYVRNGKIELGQSSISGWESQGTVSGEIIM